MSWCPEWPLRSRSAVVARLGIGSQPVGGAALAVQRGLDDALHDKQNYV